MTQEEMTNEFKAKTLEVGTCPEVELLLCCARTHINTATGKRIENLLQRDLDWYYLTQIVSKQRVTPLLYSSLKKTCLRAVPQTILTQLQQDFDANVQHNSCLLKELLKLLNLFKEHDIPAIPYKGPVLAVSVYGNLALRQFSDLDIWIHKQDMQKAEEMLVSIGYRLEKNLVWEKHFFSPFSQVHLDLHQEIARGCFRFTFDFTSCWKQVKPIFICGNKIPGLSPEILLVILCVQIGKDYWDQTVQLSQICDVAELICACPTLDWEKVWRQASKSKTRRMLVFGLYLVRELFGTVIPSKILQRMQSDSLAKLASVDVTETLFQEIEHTKKEPIFLGQEEERNKIIHFFRQVITPTEKERALLTLPEIFGFLYYLIRPIRLVSKYGLNLLKHLQ